SLCWKVGDALESDTLCDSPTRRHVHVGTKHSVLRAPPNLYVHLSRRYSELARSSRVEIGVFELPLGPIERFVGMTPRVVRSVASTLGGRHRNPRRKWATCSINDTQMQRPCSALIAPLPRLYTDLSRPWELHHPQRRVAAFVGDVRNPLAVVRPARRRDIELAVAQRKGIAPLARHQPQLIPLTAQIGAVPDARAVGRPIGTRFPRRLFVAKLTQRRAGACL